MSLTTRSRRPTAAPVPPASRLFLAACGLAGALAVPWHAFASPVAALVAVLAGLLGLRLWRWSGLPALLRINVNRRSERVVWPIASLGFGLLVGLLLLAVIRLVIEPGVPAAGARIAEAATLPIERRALIIYVAAVGEEVMFRLQLLSALAGLTTRLLRPGVAVPSRAVVWSSIALSTAAFAAVHLPAWSAAGPLSSQLALAVLSLNGVGGAVFGYLFVTRGIVPAMCAHAGADCAILLVGPLT